LQKGETVGAAGHRVDSQIGKWLLAVVDIDHCWWCGKRVMEGFLGPDRREVHHICRQSQAPKRTRDHPSNLFICCSACHARVLDACDVSFVLAKKLLRDPEHFSLEAWLRIKDPQLVAPERVTLREIARHLAFEGYR